jgi:hypothetical protein
MFDTVSRSKHNLTRIVWVLQPDFESRDAQQSLQEAGKNLSSENPNLRLSDCALSACL